MVMIGVAYGLVEATTRATSIYAKQVAKGLFLLYPFFVPPTFLYYLLADPTLPETVKFVGSALTLFSGVPSILHMFVILGMVEARMRSLGYGLLGWFRGLPWGNPAFGSLLMGMLSYVHPMAAGGASLVFMGATYYIVPLLTGRLLWGLPLARVQPYLFAGALLIFAVTGTLAGYAGVPRRTPSVDYGGSAPPSWALLMNLTEGVGGVLALVGGLLFFTVVLGTALRGAPLRDPEDLFRHLGLPEGQPVRQYRRSPVALVPGVPFVAAVLALTAVTFSLPSPIRFE